MAYISLFDIKQELVVFLRNQDILSISERGVSTTTDNFTAAGGVKTFTLTNTNAKNIRSVEVNSSEINFGSDYSVDYTTAIVSIPSVNDGDTVDIEYDYGNNDRIFPDYPQPYTKLSQFPRVGFDIISARTREVDIGAASNTTFYTVSMSCYDRSQQNVEELVATLREKIMDNKKNFYNFTFITPVTMSPLIVSPFGQDKIMQRSHDFEIWVVLEQG